MLKIVKQFKQVVLKNPQKRTQSATLSKDEQDAITHPGIIGLAAIWDVYDMWI